jgi:hypothetical protein
VKLAFLVFLLIATATIEVSASESARLEVKTASQAVSLDSPKELTAKFWLQQLVLSALYRDVVQDSTVSEWATALQAEATIHCRYPANSLLAIPERRTLTFDEILLPVPTSGWPAYVYLKHGSTYTRVAKYDPWVLEKLKVEAGLSTTLEPTVSRGLF